MIEIRKVDNSGIEADFLTESGVRAGERTYFICAMCAGERLGFLQYDITDKIIDIKYVSDCNGDFQLVLALIKTMLSQSDPLKTPIAILPINYSRIAQALGFDTKNDYFVLKLENYTQKCEG